MTVARHHQSKYSPAKLALGLVLTAALAAGCAYTGGVGEPFSRKFQWFSYIAGDDIRANCKAGSPAQYRLVYNANWQEQVRAYDVRRSVIVGGGARMWAQVFGGDAPITNFTINDPQAPWRGEGGQASLSEDQYLALIRAVEVSGFGQPSPEGLRLDSWDFYWVVTACADGQFHMNAWKYPSDRFAAISFDKPLFAADNTGKRVNPPGPVDSAVARAEADRLKQYYFQLRVGRNGFVGSDPLF